MTMTAEQQRHTKDARLTIQAANVYAALASPFANENTIYHELHTAWHEGWQTGFREREEVNERYGPDYRALMAAWCLIGFAGGFALALSLLR